MNNSPYLDQPTFPLAIAVPLMLAQIESDQRTARGEEWCRLEIRARLLRELLAASRPDPSRR